MGAASDIRAVRALGAVLGVLALMACAGCGDRKVVGEQCESPLLQGIDYYGTSCAPCTGQAPKLDARGCPMFVTFESCGGDICVGDLLIKQASWPDASPDASLDASDDDAGAEGRTEGAGE